MKELADITEAIVDASVTIHNNFPAFAPCLHVNQPQS